MDEPPEGGGQQQQPRLLLIDDEATIRSALSRFFTRRGWAVTEAENGAIALRLLRAGGDPPEFDVILSDLKMPGVSGIQLHDHLARERPDLLPRLVFSTGDVGSEEAANFARRTRCHVLQKPFELGTLADVVDKVRAL